MTIYCGVDFHARQQTVAYCDMADGEAHLRELEHGLDEVRGFYSSLTGEVVVGIEASGYSTWFVELVEGLGHQVLIGDASEIRRLAKRRMLLHTAASFKSASPLTPAARGNIFRLHNRATRLFQWFYILRAVPQRNPARSDSALTFCGWPPSKLTPPSSPHE